MLPPTLQVTALRAFTDNYIWVIHSPLDPQQVVVVDPGDAQPVRAALRDHQWSLAGILITHHHTDHIGGVAELVQAYSPTIFGPATERIPGQPQLLREGDRASFPSIGLSFTVLDVPGHTAGH